jgi:diguanylate cyclase
MHVGSRSQIPFQKAGGRKTVMQGDLSLMERDLGRAPAVADAPDHDPFGRMVDRQLAACRRYGASLAVLSISLDGLRTVRERHGQDIEHRLLEAAWQRLRSRLRAGDVVVRVGAEAFGAILVNAAASGVPSVEARIFDELSAPYRIGSLVVEITACVGGAVYTQAGTTGEALVAAAQQARAANSA